MNNDDIERLPEKVSTGMLSTRAAAKLLWRDMYLHPMRYGLNMRDDEKSDFLLYLQERIEPIFSEFKPGKILFRTYVWGFVRNTLQTWARKMKKKYYEEETIRTSLREKFEDENAKYNEEFEIEEDEIPPIMSKQFRQEKERVLAENVALILALKNCHHISQKVLDNVSKFSNIDKAELEKKIEKLKKKTDYKSAQREHIIRRRDNAFYYHRKYLLELQKLKKGSATFESVMKKYQQQTENWVKQNKLLSHRYVLSPSNVDIAEELGIKPRRVSFYISHVRKRRSPFLDDAESAAEEQDDSPEKSD